jgi:hypothetical protein
VAKKEWIKTSFWMPENGTEVSNDIKAPVSKLVCPFSKDQGHTIKVKDLIKLDISEDMTCWLCLK